VDARAGEQVDPRRVVEVTLRHSGHGMVPIDVHASTPARPTTDKRRVERVLTNLLDNAERHANGPTRVVLSGSDGGVRIAVEDHGPGVPVDERDLIFERFRRGSQSAGPGNGLGLAIASGHCRVLGGAIAVEDRVGGGSVFVFEVPDTDPVSAFAESPADPPYLDAARPAVSTVSAPEAAP